VTVRAREFAIRQALGASPTDVIRRLTVEALVMTISGVLAGLALLPLSTRAVRSLVVDSRPLDLSTVAAVACLLVIGTVVSVYWPARRAGRTDPGQLLKAER
jgi:putative ABC transport system permease protein